MNCERLIERLDRFPDRYFKNFDHIWKWKLRRENEDTSILHKYHIDEAHERLSVILPRWQTYRNGENSRPLKTLKESLKNISEAYEIIRQFSLLDFEDIPKDSLEKIWHELGRVKEFEGRKNQGAYYYAIAVCKPLLLIWGQTLAFDSKVRKNLPSNYGISKYRSRMTFEE
jgi:hypothetical protein